MIGFPVLPNFTKLHNFTTAVAQDQTEKQKRWKLFGIGLAVRLFGLALIWLGDGDASLFRKSLVVAGVILSVGGIGILRYMLISGFRKKK